MKKPQEPLTLAEEEVLRLLENFRFSPETDLADRRISNHDAACYLMYHFAMLKSNRLSQLLRVWRARSAVKFAVSKQAQPDVATLAKSARRAMKLQFRYLFNSSTQSGYGFVGKNIDSRYNMVRYYNYCRPYRDVMRQTYWYRLHAGLYGITQRGLDHGKYLSKEMKKYVVA